MFFSKTIARTNIARHFANTLNTPLRIKDLAAHVYAMFVAEFPDADSATAIVRISGTASGPEYLRTTYQAIAAMRRRGDITTTRNGVVCLSRPAVSVPGLPRRTPSGPIATPFDAITRVATPVAAAPAATPTPAPTQSAAPVNGSPRATLDSFISAISGDASAWTRAYTLDELPSQVAALEALREFVNNAAAILAEEGGQP